MYGFGKTNTPRPFVSACDRFIYTDSFGPGGVDEPVSPAAVVTVRPVPPPGLGDGVVGNASVVAVSVPALPSPATPVPPTPTSPNGAAARKDSSAGAAKPALTGSVELVRLAPARSAAVPKAPNVPTGVPAPASPASVVRPAPVVSNGAAAKKDPPGAANKPAQPSPARTLRTALTGAINATVGADGWAQLSAVGSSLRAADPSFAPRNFGHKKLGDLVRAQSYLDVLAVPLGDGSPLLRIAVRLKKS